MSTEYVCQYNFDGTYYGCDVCSVSLRLAEVVNNRESFSENTNLVLGISSLNFLMRVPKDSRRIPTGLSMQQSLKHGLFVNLT